ncbi:putative cytochrome P450 [Gordonia namibiensis NBRC 108229]|uniref:Putative cytochrome P450 n=1 Tax=Gordonia namibiensis NBRC 108229 TaxID=1208314 RepID=K6XVA9_9ACTN|nr:cytochrome P450 [Gordonia namibiensis]GAC02785.1 putative cytochrome P450 [Gordonia namibiensis NBRC 108229]
MSEAMPSIGKAGVLDTARILAGVLTPIVSEGVLARREVMVRLGGRLNTHGRAARILDDVRDKYEADALRLRFPRAMVVALRPPAVREILSHTPDPFTSATREKVSAVGRFQPTGVLISDGKMRTVRRELNERALQTSSPVHTLHQRCAEIVASEVDDLLGSCPDGRLTWDSYVISHWRMVRRLVFGDDARDDDEVTDLLTVLRRDANWAYAFPRRKSTYSRFRRRLEHLVARAPADSLAGLIRDASVVDRVDIDPIGQIPQWLFAFDAVAVAVHRSLALLAAHPDALERAREDVRTQDGGGPPRFPFIRATVLESLRLWPTTLAILRETKRDVQWVGGVLPAGATTVVIGEHFQRDDEAMDFAQHFTPDAWLDGRTQELSGVVPFSDGPGECPGRNVVMLFSSLVIAALLRQHGLRDDTLTPRVRSGVTDMPHSFNHFDLTIELVPVDR